MDTLLAKLSEQQAILEKQKNTLTPRQDDRGPHEKEDSSPGSVLLTPGSDTLSKTQVEDETQNGVASQLDTMEMVRLKKELDAAKDQIARQKKELDQSRVIKHTYDKIPGSSSGAELQPKLETSNVHHGVFNSAPRTSVVRQDNWSHNEDARSEFSDAVSAGAFTTAQNIWSSPARPPFSATASVHSNQSFQQPSTTWGQPGARPWNHRGGPALPSLIMPQQRNFSGPMSQVSANDVRAFSDYNQFQGSAAGIRRSNVQNTRNTSLLPLQRNNGWDIYPAGMGSLDSVNAAINANGPFQSMGLYANSIQYQPRPIGTPLSPTAEEFRTSQASATPWNAAVSFGCHVVVWSC